MNIRRFFVAKTIGFIVVMIFVGLFFLLNNYIYQEKQSDDLPVEPYRATLEGTYVCLPNKDTVNVPEESDCEPGIKTATEEYYAVNFMLMSQMSVPLEVGQRFSGTGVITPVERLSTNQWQKYEVMGIFSVTDSLTLLGSEDESYACPADAKLCPDGTYVGRKGPQCEFVACSTAVTLPIKVTASINEDITVMDLTISPQEIISDSRCPVGVECVWAGTVEVRTTLATPVSHGEHALTLGKPQMFGDYSVTLVAVLPTKTQEAIVDDLYEFTYLVSSK